MEALIFSSHPSNFNNGALCLPRSIIYCLKMRSTSKTIIAARRDKSNASDIILSIIEGKYNPAASVTQARIIEQISSKNHHGDVCFEARDAIAIKQEMVLEAIEVVCREDNGRIVISQEEYQRITSDITHQSEESSESVDDDR